MSQARAHYEFLGELEKTQKAAVEAYIAKQQKAKEENQRPAGLRFIAEQFGICHTTLSNHLKGWKTKMEQADEDSNLSHTKAITLIDFAISLAD
jgi:hypothetical protein